jgi:hypothetical protein
MTGRRASSTALFAVSASAVAAFALSLALTAPDRSAHRQPPAQRPIPRGPAAYRPVTERRTIRASRRAISRIARSFAIAYLRWDAGRRTRGVAATLRRLSAPGLWASLGRQRDRPTARQPRPPDAIRPFTVALGSDGYWRASLAARGGTGRYLATLVLADEVSGMRVVGLHR